MTHSEKVAALKVDLQITTTAYDDRLGQYIDSAASEIKREGYTLRATIADDNLQIMYAAWLWRRRDTGEGMPRMIRWELNNRLFDLNT